MYLSPSTARGVDGTSYDRFISEKNKEIELISSRALNGCYKFSPYRQKLIIKDEVNPPRQISIPTIRDKIALRAINNFLTELFPNSRPQHSHPIISSAIKSIKNAQVTDKYIKLDIKSFYDHINHNLLIRNLRRKIRSSEPISIIESAICTPTGVKISKNIKNEIGVPQGLSISNILASIYLEQLDEKYSSILGLSYHRYVDDILCIVAGSEAVGYFKEISKGLNKKKLKVHPLGEGKSIIDDVSSVVDYLGYSICGDIISVREATVKKLLSSIIRIVESSSESNRSRAVWRLNLRISGCRLNGSYIGWIFYFSQINDLSLLSRIDAQVRKAVRKKYGANGYEDCKRFIKAYYEARYDRGRGKYYIDFDSYSKHEMLSLLGRLLPDRIKNIEKKDESDIRRIFNRVVTREVREMERDTVGSFS